jgi:hypothetical protein
MQMVPDKKFYYINTLQPIPIEQRSSGITQILVAADKNDIIKHISYLNLTSSI